MEGVVSISSPCSHSPWPRDIVGNMELQYNTGYPDHPGATAPTYAEVGLTLGTVILGLPPQNPAAAVRRVPAEVTRQGGAVTSLGGDTHLMRGTNVSTSVVTLGQ